MDIAHHSGAKFDLLDRAGRSAHVDEVADAVLVLDDDEDTGDEIGDQGLGPEADRQADDAGACDERAQVEPQLAQHRQGGHRVDGKAGNAAQNRPQS